MNIDSTRETNSRSRGAHTGLLVALCLVGAAAMAIPEDAFAQRRGGGGAMARSSVSGATRGSAAMAGNRAASGNVSNTVNRASAGNRASSRDTTNTGNRVNTGDINIDNSVNVDRGDWNINVDADYGVRPGYGYPGYGYPRYPVAAGVAVGAAVGTAIAVGSMYSALPPGCPVVHTYAVPYYYCGGYYYQQKMQGDSVVYIVVTP